MHATLQSHIQEPNINKALILLTSLTLSACALPSSGTNTSPFKGLPFFSQFQNTPETYTLEAYNQNAYKWWENYNDPTLNNLISTLLNQNLDLKIAAERLLQAQEQINITQSSLYPTISADAGASRQANPTNTNGLLPSSGTNYQTNQNLGLSAAWQIDLFGQIRNQSNANQSTYLAAQSTRDALTQSLIAQLITTRLSIANLNAEKDLINQTIQSREKTLAIIERRYETGLENSSALDVRLAREALASAKSQLPRLNAALTEATYTLNILLGEMPNATENNTQSDFPILPPPDRLILPPPVALLDLRPDLRADAYRLNAAKYEINVALTFLYPNLALSAGYGFQSDDLGDLISTEKLAWNLLSNLTQPLFEGGRLRANIRLKESIAREMAATYSKNILTATQEVENALQTEENARQQLDALTKTNNEAQKAYDLANKRYERGLVTITDLLDIERRILTQKQEILNVQQSIWNARITLHLALGGQWITPTATPNETL